jgi:hypothetical protein
MCWRLRFPPKGLVVASSDKADVAELADALDSKSSTGNSVWVRSPPSAERDSERCSPFTSRQGTPFLRCQAGMLRLLRARLLRPSHRSLYLLRAAHGRCVRTLIPHLFSSTS